MVEEECGSLELEEKKVEKVEVSTAEKAEKPAPKKWVARPLTTVRILNLSRCTWFLIPFCFG